MRTITIGELRQFINEASTKNEFKPKFGNGVEGKNKEINGKAIKDIEKAVKSYDGGLSKKDNKPSGGLNDEENLSMSDLEYDSINQPFKDRVKAQMAGYTSVSDKKNHPNEFEGNEVFDKQGKNWDAAKKHAKEVNNDRVKMHMAGLTGRTQTKTDVENLHQNVFSESKKIKCLTFNKTEFLTEGHMLSKIPDEYKKDGSRFIMKDKKSNEYLVEWIDNKPSVTKKVNLTEVQQEKDRIKHLWEYKSSDYNKNTTCSSRLSEDKGFEDMLNKARKLM